MYINLVDEKKLLKFAVDYLSKYDSSKVNLINVLKRKIFKLNIEPKEKNNLQNYLKNIIIKLEQGNFINDDRYSFSKIVYLAKLGKSKNYIHNYLIKKGIDKSIIQSSFDEFKKNDKDWELHSAKLFAEKKKLLNDRENYEKKLAKMARAGFNYEICKKILN